MRLSAPIVVWRWMIACAPMRVRAPIRTSGPITQYGPTSTPSPRIASGATIAVAWMVPVIAASLSSCRRASARHHHHLGRAGFLAFDLGHGRELPDRADAALEHDLEHQ